MPETFIDLPDGKKLVVFETNQHPDFTGTSINIQETLSADIPTYQVVADNIAPGLNKNILAIFNNLPTKRIRVQEVYVYPRTTANHVITLQLLYINAAPTGGTDITLLKHSADFPNNPSPPNNIIAKSESTATPVAGISPFGGATFSVNQAGTYIIFAPPNRNGSALQLRQGGLDGLVLRQVTGTGTTGTITAHMTFVLD
jgi:hypothetical protein